jgi:hypothetical protein
MRYDGDSGTLGSSLLIPYLVRKASNAVGCGDWRRSEIVAGTKVRALRPLYCALRKLRLSESLIYLQFSTRD